MGFFQWYYVVQCVCHGLWWGLVYGMTGKHVYEVLGGSVVTSPAWLVGPEGAGNLMHWLSRRRRVVFLFMPYAMGMAAYGDNSAYFFPRYVAALGVAVYHASETSLSRRHGEYGLLYSAWSCVLPEPVARGACLGVAVHFVLSAGVAKLRVGGAAWCGPETMRVYLEAYRTSTSALARPYSPRLSAFCGARLPSLLAAGTLALECVAAPLSLASPPGPVDLGCFTGSSLVSSGSAGLGRRHERHSSTLVVKRPRRETITRGPLESREDGLKRRDSGYT